MVWGCDQIPKVDFNERYHPLVSIIKMCVIILVWLIEKWNSQIIYSETVFLYGTLEEEIHTNIILVMVEALGQ